MRHDNKIVLCKIYHIHYFVMPISYIILFYLSLRANSSAVLYTECPMFSKLSLE